MKINLIYFISNFTFGGAGNSIVRLCTNLNRNKYSINIICIGKSGYYKILKKNKIRLIEIKKTKLLYSVFILVKIINSLIVKDKKNILISNIHYNNVVILFLKKFLKSIKIVLVERTPIEELKIYFNLKDFIKKQIINNLIKLHYHKSDYIICNSSGIKKGLKNVTKKPIKIIYPPSLVTKKRERKYIYENLNLFCFTRLSNEKNIILLFKAIKYLDNKKIILNIYGDGPEKNKLIDYVFKNKLNKNIFFKGFRENMNSINEQIYISTSLFEGCSNSTIEAINNSKITICSNCPGGNAEILLYGKGGELFESNDYKSLANSIEKVIKEPKKYYKKTLLARKQLSKFFLKKNQIEYEKIFNSL